MEEGRKEAGKEKKKWKKRKTDLMYFSDAQRYNHFCFRKVVHSLSKLSWHLLLILL